MTSNKQESKFSAKDGNSVRSGKANSSLTEYAYSNAGYVVLAQIVARASGQSFKDWTRINIFVPFRMEGAAFRDDLNERLPGAAFSYERRGDGSFARALDNEAAPGPGSLLISAEDLASWLSACQSRTMGGDIWEKMIEPGKLADGRALNCAAGLILGSYRGLPILHHSGRWTGYRGDTVFFPDERVAVAVLTNNFGIDPTQLSRRIADIYLEGQLGPVQARPAASANIRMDALEQFVGRYGLMGERILEITRRENRLFAQLTGDLNWEVFPETDDTFVYRGVDAKIQFDRAEEGSAPRLIYWQGPYAMSAERIPAGKWSPAAPQDFCGHYYSEELGYALEVKLNEKGLFIPFIRRSDLLLVPVAEDSFAGKDSSTKLRFVRGNNGKIVEFRFSMTDARNVKFARVEKPS